MKDISKSLNHLRRVKERIPGVSQLLSKRPDRFSEGVWPGYFSRAAGTRVWDLDGNEYLDMSIGGIGATVLGYADPDVDGAVRDAIGNGVASSLNCPEELELADLLCELHPWADMARFGRCGGEAMAMAVRIARAKTGRDVVAFCGYHGWHDWYLAANIGSGDALSGHLQAGLDPLGVPAALAGTAHPFAYNDLEALAAIVEQHGANLAAVVMEPTRGAEPAPGFLPGVRELADSCGAVLILDEISAGFRLTTGGAHLLYGLTPDMAVFSKALGNGYPISAVIGRGEVMDAARYCFISSTNWTERTGPAAALATIGKFRRMDAASHLMRLGQAVQEGLRELAAKHGLPMDVGGMKPMTHFSFKDGDPHALKALFVQEMLDRDILASTLCYMMHAHTMDDVGAYLQAADEALAVVAEARAAGDAEGRLRGASSVAGFKRMA
ncbi:aminotransferase class III-fold pyridoxal phosphate-dependent enzyme [Desulfohalovibrio reitneri]|uniref:aminotransferase class III-fold pyridoxal phosphate-dependent enzyme n=1 Tax=Desulfohalovibrio reitneri TaxID=1307759 RepID=UPI0004A70B36|nr:aminotransferase class III-fold pyridoxal phosphate-dependent enzyme [Desulfohalovibrio reitneri]